LNTKLERTYFYLNLENQKRLHSKFKTLVNNFHCDIFLILIIGNLRKLLKCKLELQVLKMVIESIKKLN